MLKHFIFTRANTVRPYIICRNFARRQTFKQKFISPLLSKSKCCCPIANFFFGTFSKRIFAKSRRQTKAKRFYNLNNTKSDPRRSIHSSNPKTSACNKRRRPRPLFSRGFGAERYNCVCSPLRCGIPRSADPCGSPSQNTSPPQNTSFLRGKERP